LVKATIAFSQEILYPHSPVIKHIIFYWNFSNKWLSADGRHFALIFTGRKENDSFNLIRGEFITEEK
jgi:hypothetical protein